MTRYIVYISIYLIIFYSIIFYAKPKGNLLYLFCITILILFFIGLFFSYEDNRKKKFNKFTFTLKEKIIIYVKIICISAGSGFSILVGTGLITLLTGRNYSFQKYISIEYYAILISLIIVCASAICLFAPEDDSITHKNWMLGFGGVFIVLICFLGNLTPISSDIMSDLKLGNITSTLEIDYVACQAFSRVHYPIKCNPKKGYYFIDNVNIKWRSGEYYIAFILGKQTIEIIIPQIHILAVLNPVKNNKIDKRQ